MAPTRPLSPNNCNGSELSNTAAMSPFRHITWPTSVSIHDKTLKGGKIHCYSDIPISPSSPSSSSSNSSNGLEQDMYMYFLYQKASYSRGQCLLPTESL